MTPQQYFEPARAELVDAYLNEKKLLNYLSCCVVTVLNLHPESQDAEEYADYVFQRIAEFGEKKRVKELEILFTDPHGLFLRLMPPKDWFPNLHEIWKEYSRLCKMPVNQKCLICLKRYYAKMNPIQLYLF